MPDSVIVSTAILAHPARREMVEALQERIKSGQPQVYWDQEGLGQWATLRRAWLDYNVGDTYRLILEDDVWPCLDFIETAQAALTALTAHVGLMPACFYCPWQEQMDAAVQMGHAWLKIYGGAWGPATILPVKLIPYFIRWVDAHWLYTAKHDGDGRLTMFSLATHIPFYVSSSSLVEHIGWKHSLLKHPIAPGGRPRLAYRYIGAQQSALHVDWAAGLREGDKIITAGMSLKTYVRDNRWRVRPDYYEAVVNGGPYIQGPSVFAE